MSTKWLQERARGSKNEHGMPPHRAFCGFKRRWKFHLCVRWILCSKTYTSETSKANELKLIMTQIYSGRARCHIASLRDSPFGFWTFHSSVLSWICLSKVPVQCEAASRILSRRVSCTARHTLSNAGSHGSAGDICLCV